MMSLRRDLYLLLMGYSDRKDHLTADELANFLLNEQKVRVHRKTKLDDVALAICSRVSVEGKAATV